MKTRIDFVSNSSSSSFIVITDSGGFSAPRSDWAEYVSLPDAERGQTEFGWQTEKYRDFWSKLNWCAIAVSDKREMEQDETPDERLKAEVEKPWFRAATMEKRLTDACEKLGYRVEVREIGDADSWEYGYVDHQSAIYEEPVNARMFETDKTLWDFLTNDGSYIDNSNDNGGRDDDEYDYDKRRYSSQPDDYYRADAPPAPEIETGAYGDILKEF